MNYADYYNGGGGGGGGYQSPKTPYGQHPYAADMRNQLQDYEQRMNQGYNMHRPDYMRPHYGGMGGQYQSTWDQSPQQSGYGTYQTQLSPWANRNRWQYRKKGPRGGNVMPYDPYQNRNVPYGGGMYAPQQSPYQYGY